MTPHLIEAESPSRTHATIGDTRRAARGAKKQKSDCSIRSVALWPNLSIILPHRGTSMHMSPISEVENPAFSGEKAQYSLMNSVLNEVNIITAAVVKKEQTFRYQ